MSGQRKNSEYTRNIETQIRVFIHLTIINDLRNFAVPTMKTIILLTWLLFPVWALTQDSLRIHRPVSLYGLASYDFPRGYGLTAGTSIPLHSVTTHKNKNSERDEFVLGELGGYRYPYDYTSININAGFGIRYIKSDRYFGELSFSQGLLRTIYDGTVYEMDQYGDIKELKLFGRTYLTTGVSYSFNYRLNQKSLHLWFIQIKPSTWVQYPFNSFLKLHFSIQAGISYLKNHRSL